MIKTLLAATALSTVFAAGAAQAQEKLKIGVLATLEGALTTLGEDALRGLEVALRQANRKAGGREIEIITVATNASPDSAIRGIRKLVEQDRVPLVIGPVSGSEGIAIRDYSKTQPGVTVINGTSAAMETTYVTPSENFFRFNTQGAQWMVGVGDYIYNVKKYRKIAALAEDYSFPYTQLFGLTLEFCQLGGQITERHWVPLGTKDFASIIAKLPEDVDAIYLGLGGGDAVNFLNQYTQAGGKAKMIGGSIMVDQTVLSSKGAAKRALIGTPTGGPQADAWDNPKWQAWVKAYQDAFPADKRFTIAVLDRHQLLQRHQCAVRRAQHASTAISATVTRSCRATLSAMVIDAPNGKIRLDDKRQAIGPNFVTEVVEAPNGDLTNKMVKVIPEVRQTLGFDDAAFAKLGLPSRTNPECKAKY